MNESNIGTMIKATEQRVLRDHMIRDAALVRACSLGEWPYNGLKNTQEVDVHIPEALGD